MKPNLGNFETPPDWKEILKFFRGNELQNFFEKMLKSDLKALIKIQYVDSVAKSKAQKLIVGQRLKNVDKREWFDHAVKMLDLSVVLEREIGMLSGGELQRFIIAMTCVQQADIYMFDEPSSYLDVKQRLKAGRMIRSLLGPSVYVVVVEHDLSILDYLSDFICCLYGVPGAYGVVTMPMSVRQGINIFLAGFIPSENMRFRDVELTFKVTEAESDKAGVLGTDVGKDNMQIFHYPRMVKTMGPFRLEVMEGSFKPSEIVMMLGQNGTGKTTLIKMLAGILKPDDEELELPKLTISYKPQTIAPKFQGTVQELLSAKLKDSWNSSIFKTEVLLPLDIESLLDNEVQTLSGGELQRVAIVLALAKPCDIFLIDEPSAYLDSEQRVLASRVMKRWILSSKKSAFVVEHDFIMATYLADKVICFSGIPAKESVCSSPESLITGMNKFLKMMEITFRRDPSNFRPRINKYQSQKDQEQKLTGNYFLMDDDKLTKEEEDEEKKFEDSSKGKGGSKPAKKAKKDKDN
uniref:ABC transporter domain-containing protein n=1 Tax=Strombidium rassoulzadegani TaxID=1082188 RepID=A0A7S3FZ84_9SPIT|mmetsp:Transcript_8623/g.14583  ORF Transcript_8623/g.14583 Transcript_8623/m.14583 type:complete len:521 (+) Transcript_8623:407-1969(+)|eukprot:CAMPEP_0168617486 /NCGR_PEP_ID=MMETSP0449_2-20121227/5567_1 /TAXON_ID=1082188 /ORGANISM="Strombidium rassoulzadegani, Strain ras09" /LENGTH=520 /DNA_ID=CAMNT_0008658303 /DNA_START=395 /DNA_END=1957 /DNA_ORIENTATION=+